MLRLLGVTTIGDAKTRKKQFAPYVNLDATQRNHYVINFGPECLQAGRAKEPTIDALLMLFDK